MDWLGEFFRALPAVGSALWEFIDGWRGVLVTIGSIVLTVAFAMAAKALRERSGWLSAVFGAMAGLIAMWWVFGILPSAWIYFADGNQELLAGTLIPSALPGMSNFYQVFRDLVVVAESGVAMVGLVVVALRVQRRYPRALAEGEEPRPQSGGYK